MCVRLILDKSKLQYVWQLAKLYLISQGKVLSQGKPASLLKAKSWNSRDKFKTWRGFPRRKTPLLRSTKWRPKKASVYHSVMRSFLVYTCMNTSQKWLLSWASWSSSWRRPRYVHMHACILVLRYLECNQFFKNWRIFWAVIMFMWQWNLFINLLQHC